MMFSSALGRISFRMLLMATMLVSLPMDRQVILKNIFSLSFKDHRESTKKNMYC